MKLSCEKRCLVILLCLVLLSARGLSRPRQTSIGDCISVNACGNDFQAPYIKHLALALIFVGLLVVPMVFCCHSSKAKSNQQEPPHIYEDIDREIALSQTKCATKTVVTADPSCRESVKPPADPNKPPQLPDREYLTDIDFVAQEFDLILRRPPELPDRSEEENSSKNLLVVGNVSESNIANELKPSDTPKSDGKLINYQLKTVTKSARPNQYNLTGPVKTTKPPKPSKQGKAVVDGSRVTFSSSTTTRSSRQLPNRQPVATSKHTVSQPPDERSQINSPTYQNLIGLRQLQPPPTEETYENNFSSPSPRCYPCTGDPEVTCFGQSNKCTQVSQVVAIMKSQQQQENPYQPLLFGPGSEDDVYIDVDMF